MDADTTFAQNTKTVLRMAERMPLTKRSGQEPESNHSPKQSEPQPNQNKSNRIQLNQIEWNRIESNRFKPDQAKAN